MPKVGMNKVLVHLCRSLPPPDGLCDNHLLERFLANRDETAFAGIVQNHGRMVLGVCHRVLGKTHELNCFRRRPGRFPRSKHGIGESAGFTRLEHGQGRRRKCHIAG
jgi:hypothetical protein